jgi:hypothetical protein
MRESPLLWPNSAASHRCTEPESHRLVQRALDALSHFAFSAGVSEGLMVHAALYLTARETGAAVARTLGLPGARP